MNATQSHKRFLVCLAVALVGVSAHSQNERTALWPEGRMPFAESHQVPKEGPWLEWYVPQAKKCDSCLLVFPGGSYSGWCGGYEGVPVANWFASNGVTAVCVRYRTPRPAGMAKHVTAWADGQRAVRIVRREAAAHGIDPAKIGAMGFSAGGHLTLMLATTSMTTAYPRVDETDDLPAQLQFAAPVYPAYILSDGFGDVNTFGGEGPEVTVAKEFAFDAQTPPVCLLHGEQDLYSPLGSTAVYRRLREMKIPAELHLFSSTGHGFAYGCRAGIPNGEFKTRIVEWMARLGFYPKGGASVKGGRPCDASATVRTSVGPIWPEGRMPSVVTNQTYAPEIHWYEPATNTTRTCVVMAPGGAYCQCAMGYARLAHYFTAKGMTVAVLKYRTPRPAGLAFYRTAWQDARRAIRIVRSEAGKRGYAPNRIGMIGFSAGGHLTALCATSSRTETYRAIDAVDKVSASLNWAVPVFAGYTAEGGRLPDELLFDAMTPKMCIFHGDADPVDPMGSVLLWERCRRLGIPADLHQLALEPHDFQSNAAPGTPAWTWMDRIWEFLAFHGAVK